jgi:riboflavin synthase alpha subunit
VNLEVDPIAKHVERWVRLYAGARVADEVA